MHAYKPFQASSSGQKALAWLSKGRGGRLNKELAVAAVNKEAAMSVG